MVPLGTSILSDRYELVELVGSGGYGQILKAVSKTVRLLLEEEKETRRTRPSLWR